MKTSDSTRLATRFTVLCITLVLLTVAIRLPLLRLHQPIDDEVVYGVAAQTIVEGGVPYVNAVERKPPLLFYVYATVLRTCGSSNWRAVHIVEVFWILATMIGLFAIGRRLFDANTGLTAALLYSVYQAWSYWNNLAFNGEVLMNLPIAWAYAIAFSRNESRRTFNLFAAGSLLAIAFLLKQPAAIAIAPLVLYVAAPLELVSLGLGFSLILTTTGIWLFSNGLLREAFYWTITNHDVPALFWVNGIENTLAFTAFCLPITMGAWLSCRDATLWAGRTRERRVLVALVFVSLFGAASSGRFYPHYYIAVVLPCALLAAPWLARLWQGEPRTRRIAWATQAWLAGTVVIFAAAHIRGLARQPEISAAGAYLADHSKAGDRIFVWGQSTRIYLDAHRRPASRYIATFPLTGLIFAAPKRVSGSPAPDTRARIVPGSWDNLRADFAKHEPEYIVDTEAAPDAVYPVTDFPSLQKLLADDYDLVARTADGLIYRRDREKKVALAALGQDGDSR